MMEIQFGKQITLQSLLPSFKKQVKSILREANQKAGSHRGQVMKVYEYKLVKKNKTNAFSLKLVKYDEYFNIKYEDCTKYLKNQIEKYPNFKNFKDKNPKVHTELQFILEDNIKYIRRDRLYIIYSYYIPCAGNECSIVSCAEELSKFVNGNNINIIVVYSKVHENTDGNKSLEILKRGKIPIMCLDDPNNIQI